MADNTPIELGQLEAAQRQIDTAITLYFTDGDCVSAYGLTFAASDVLRDLADAGKKKTVFSDFIEHIKPEMQKEFLDFIRKPQMFIKHANQNPGEKINFYPRSYELPLLLACELYAELTEEPTQRMEMYHIWRLSENPKLIQSPIAFRDILETLNDIIKGSDISKMFFYENTLNSQQIKQLHLLKSFAIGNNKNRAAN